MCMSEGGEKSGDIPEGEKINKRKEGAGRDRAPATRRMMNSENTTWKRYPLAP